MDDLIFSMDNAINILAREECNPTNDSVKEFRR